MSRKLRGLVHLLFGIPIGAVTLVTANLVAGANGINALVGPAILGAFIGALMGFVWTWVMRRYGHHIPWVYRNIHSVVGAGSILRNLIWVILAFYGSPQTLDASPLRVVLFVCINIFGSLATGLVSYIITGFDKDD